MKKTILTAVILLMATLTFSQDIAIDENIAYESAIPDVTSNEKGVLIPRMKRYPGKASFRPGGVTGTNWDKNSTGVYSLAMGNNGKAKGSDAVALGYNATSSGNYSTAMEIATMQQLLPGTITSPERGWECGNPLVDARDGQSYETVKIGSQCWMAENLNIGTRINGGANQTNNGIIEKYCYNNSEAECDIYGGLYQWSEMMGHVTVAGVTGICPQGWHIPTDEEWCILEQEVDPSITCNSTGWRGINGGGDLKEDGTSHWADPNVGATNNSGFTALPGGIGVTGGTFAWFGYFGYWWTSNQFDATTAWQRDLYYEVAQIRRLAALSNKLSGYSVRCLKDEIPILPYYNLNILIEPAGAGTASGAGQYEPGEIILLTTTANSGWQFANWTDDDGIVSNAPGFSYTMPLQDVTLTANFVDEQAGFNCGDPLIDARDDKSYATLQLGDQCWMAESLNYGTMIMGNQAMTDNGIVEKYCYNNDEANCTIYGALYQWNEMMQYTTTSGLQGICPEGWHVPTDAEWTALTNYVSSQPEYLCSNNTNYIAKALASTTYWFTSTTSCAIGRTLSANNATGFTGLPAGFRAANGSFNTLNGSLDFWSSTEQLSTTAMRRYMYFSNRDVAANPTEKTRGVSVRCVRYTGSVGVPVDLPLDGVTVGSGQENCYNASQSITVQNFTVQSGGQASFIAGASGSIVLLPETRVHHDGYLHAYITLDETYCTNPSSLLNSDSEPGETEIQDIISEKINSELVYYPNPTHEFFTIDLSMFKAEDEVLIEVFSMHGEAVYRGEIQGSGLSEINLSGKQPGLYIIRLVSGKKVMTGKILKL